MRWQGGEGAVVRGLVGFGKFSEGFEIVGLVLVERVAGDEVDDAGDGFKFGIVMQRAWEVQAAECFVGLGQLCEAGGYWFGGVHRLRGRFSSDFCCIRHG